MIIVEGTDKAGKSTFISNLIKFLPQDYKKDVQIVHFGLLPDNWDYCDDYLQYIKPNIILDRFIDSELVYGPVYRKTVNPRLTSENILKVYKKCISIGTLVIHCNPSESIVFNRIQKEGDELIKKIEQLKALRSGFNQLYNENYPIDYMEVDTSNQLSTDNYKSIIKKYLSIKSISKNIESKNYRGFINHNTKYLIYTKNKQDEDLITKIIFKDNKNIKDFGIVMSRNTENKQVNINDLLNVVNVSKVITLGEESQEDYKNSGSSIKPIFCKNLSNLFSLFTK